MNTKQFQFNRQLVILILLAGLVLALTARLVEAGAEATGLTLRPACGVWDGANVLQPGPTGEPASGVECHEADFLGLKSGLLSACKVGGGTPFLSIRRDRPTAQSTEG